MRRIDADALMQSLGITNMDCDKCAWYDKKWSRCKRGGDFEDACCAIENAPTIEPQHWIPCEERLPKNDEKVLVTVKNGEVLFGNYHGKHWAYGSKVVAWMPLPEPYKGDET